MAAMPVVGESWSAPGLRLEPRWTKERGLSADQLAAEVCLTDFLAPLVAQSPRIPPALESLARAGWCGWAASEAGFSALPGPDLRTVHRYAAELREQTGPFLPGLLTQLIRRLFWSRGALPDHTPLNPTQTRRLILPSLPWCSREQVTESLEALRSEGLLSRAGQGYQALETLWGTPLPVSSGALGLAQLLIDLYPTLVAWLDGIPGASLGILPSGGLPPVELAQGLEAGATSSAGVANRESRRHGYAMHLHTIRAPTTPPLVPLPVEIPLWPGLVLAAAALPGWGDPEQALRGLKGAVAQALERVCQDLPGGLYRAVHRRHRLGFGTFSSYLDAPLLSQRCRGSLPPAELPPRLRRWQELWHWLPQLARGVALEASGSPGVITARSWRFMAEGTGSNVGRPLSLPLEGGAPADLLDRKTGAGGTPEAAVLYFCRVEPA